MKITGADVQYIADMLGELAALYDPKDAAAIHLLIKAGTELNDMIKLVREQTIANAPEVWDQVRTDYADALAAFEASIA